MGQKRATKKSARPPPPPPPPAGSSEEEDSRSRSEESEDEAVARTPTPSKPLAPPQRAEESDSSDEEEEGDEEEEEEEAPKNLPAPPQKGQDSESSGDEEEGDEDEEEEEPAHLAAPSAPKNQPPPPQQSKESDASDEDGESSESDDEEAPPPPPKQAPKRQADAIKPPSAKKARLAFHRIWSTDDEVRILEALAAHQKQHGALPQPDALIGALAGKLDNRAYGSKELQSKLQTLKKRYVVLSSRGELPSKEHDRRLLDLSKMVWGGDKTAPAAAAAAAAEAASGRELKGFDEMCELYPYLAEEVKKLEAAHPGMFKRVFGKMDDGKARAMDEKIKKQRVAQMKVELRRTDLTKEVSKAITELVD
ncbi:nucleolar and coiled-body phosphoprotein 1-like [Lolium rigidum]|uniref:nucleolar and coiled-body phosphoprotein 1-like n=1 Tax=Lolium rigidum TaxID=89674 RepID=UPI001F5CA7F5|nr:nucleolar and coiled-body phosphoprotein 1-like [Lolium rigidum]